MTFQLAEIDPRMTLTRTRRVLEYVVNEVYRRHFDEDPGTRPLENLLQRLIKEHVLPPKVGTYASGIREMGNLGTHGKGDEILPSDAQHSLDQLVVILLWYFEQERPESLSESSASSKPVQAAAASQPPPSEPALQPRSEQDNHQGERSRTRFTASVAGSVIVAVSVGYVAFELLLRPPPAPTLASMSTPETPAQNAPPTPMARPTAPVVPAAPGAGLQAPATPSAVYQSQEKPTLDGDVTQVLDSSAVIVAGKIVNLYGVRGEDGRPAVALQRYLRSQGTHLACFARAGDTYQCFANGQDVGEKALRNGWARTREPAPQAYVAAEQEARKARRGVWGS